MIGLPLFLILSTMLFSLGLFAVLTRRSAILLLIGVELMLAAANLNFIAFWRFGPNPAAMTGALFVLFSIAVAAAEAAVGLSLILVIYRHLRSTNPKEVNSLHG
jgi:NADH-quinone oxidoreductase subunit K